MRLDDISAKEAKIRERQRVANEKRAMDELSPVFLSAVKAWGGQDAFASRLGVNKSVVSDMCNGKRIIGPRDWLPLMEEPGAWAIWTRGLAGVGGLDVSVYRKPEVTLAMVRDLIVDVVMDEIRKGSIVGEAILNEAAKRGGVTREDVDGVIERGEDEARQPGQQDA